MVLISLGDDAGTNILIDCNIRSAADDANDPTRDVAKDLRRRLNRDSKGRPYVDVFLNSHPDKDHCRGLKEHFHLGPLDEYADDKKADNEKRIVIAEMWSSPIVFRRATKVSGEEKLCDEAQAFQKEAKRRVRVARKKNFSGIGQGDRVLIFGEDKDGKTDDLGPILVKVDDVFDKVNGTKSKILKARLLGPLSFGDENEEELLTKNHSSVILNFELADDVSRKTIKNFLIGGDAGVLIWERLWEKHKKNPDVLAYDLFLTPHHCSWHSLSYDSRSEKGDKAKVCAPAKKALSQIRSSGKIIASSKPIENDDCDPPSHAAKLEYVSIAKTQNGEFFCTDEEPSIDKPAPLDIVLAEGSLVRSLTKAVMQKPNIMTAGLIDQRAEGAAHSGAVQKGGNTRYA